MTLFKLTFKNLWRKPYRNFSIIFASALACGLLFSAFTILESVEQSLKLGVERLGADIMVVPESYQSKGRKVLLAGEPTTFYMDGEVLADLASFPGVDKVSPQLFMVSAELQCCSMPTVLLVGYDPATDFTIAPWVRHQHQVSQEKIDQVTIGAETLYASESPIMTFFGKRFKIGTSLFPTGLGFLDYSIFMPMSSARDMINVSQEKSLKPLIIDPDEISSVLVRVEEGYDINYVADQIEENISGVKAIATKNLITSVRKVVQGSLWGVISAGSAALLMTIALMGIVFAMVVNERQRELGLLRAMGAKRKDTFKLIIFEALTLSGGGAVSGICLGLLIIITFKKMIVATLDKVAFMWASPLSLVAIALVCIISVMLCGTAAALFPALKSCRRVPNDALRQGR